MSATPDPRPAPDIERLAEQLYETYWTERACAFRPWYDAGITVQSAWRAVAAAATADAERRVNPDGHTAHRFTHGPTGEASYCCDAHRHCYEQGHFDAERRVADLEETIRVQREPFVGPFVAEIARLTERAEAAERRVAEVERELQGVLDLRQGEKEAHERTKAELERAFRLVAEQRGRANDARRRLAEALEWRDNVSAAIKTAPEFESGEWAGDKEGWGYHFEVVRYMVRRLAEAPEREGRIREKLTALKAAYDWWMKVPCTDEEAWAEADGRLELAINAAMDVIDAALDAAREGASGG